MNGVHRIKLVVAYDGTNFCGWQKQPGKRTVEGELNRAISQIAGEDIEVIGASRTDAGVHAYGNVAVFDTKSSIPGEKWAHALNTALPGNVSIVGSREVESDFHPRFCDTVKTYEYTILNSKFKIPTYSRTSWHVPYELDIDKMREAASYLIGPHDFKSFCSSKTQADSTVRTVFRVKIEEEPLGEDYFFEDYENEALLGRKIVISITGDGFLYNMVRIIAGTLVDIGKGRFEPEKTEEMIVSKDRTTGGVTAPPQGLCLVGIEY